MEFNKTWLPDLNRPGMKSEEKIQAINEYLISFEKQIRHVLCNIDKDNFSEELIASQDGITDRLKALEEGGTRSEHASQTGGVSSVDNVLPDENGNVLLGAVRLVNGKKPDDSGNVTVEPGPQGEQGPAGAYQARSAILISSSWAKQRQSISVDGVTADAESCHVIVSPAPDSHADYIEAGIRCVEQKAGALVFAADNGAPKVNISVNVLIFK